MFALSATQAPLSLEQCPTVLLQPLGCASVHVSPGDRVHKALFFTVFTLGRVLQSFKTALSVTPPSHRQPSATVLIIINSQASDPVVQPAAFFCLSAHLLFML